MRELTGSLDQMPPPYSAKKIGGVRSHRLGPPGRSRGNRARPRGSRACLKSRNSRRLRIQISCRLLAGTYVRSLAHDLGQQLGCGAHLTSLRRLRSGRFQNRPGCRAWTAHPRSDVIPLDDLFLDWPAADQVSGTDEAPGAAGKPDSGGSRCTGFARIFNKQGEFMLLPR